MEFYLPIKNNKILLFAITWMNFEGRERQISYDPTYMWNLKNKTNKQNQAYRYRNKLIVLEGWMVGGK